MGSKAPCTNEMLCAVRLGAAGKVGGAGGGSDLENTLLECVLLDAQVWKQHSHARAAHERKRHGVYCIKGVVRVRLEIERLEGGGVQKVKLD
jgi:hypothetical protein